MSCIACDSILITEDKNVNYCGICEKCPMCNKDFCNFECVQECVACGVETIESNYCGFCEKCPMCNKDFCNFGCVQECIACGVETIETNYCGCEKCGACGKDFCNFECQDDEFADNNSEHPEENEENNNID